VVARVDVPVLMAAGRQSRYGRASMPGRRPRATGASGAGGLRLAANVDRVEEFDQVMIGFLEEL
jgi:hypothetical protein